MPESPAPSASWFPLIAHKAGYRLYNLSAGLNYVSIKDQAVRACALVDSIKAAGWLDRFDPITGIVDLVVVGAGAAGVTAAWRAASYGLNVLVVEKSDTPFSALLGCTDRRVSFSMYDWPEPFCAAQQFPSLHDQPIRGKRIDEDSFPVYSDADGPQLASVYAAQWLRRLGLDGKAVCINAGKYPITWNFGIVAVPQRLQASRYARLPPTISVELSSAVSGAPPRTIQAANVIMATGIGAERAIGGYQPPPFWSVNHDAPWAAAPLGKPTRRKSIVISGAGDGAIQDTLKSLASMAVANLIPLAEHLLNRKDHAHVKARLLAAERHAERQLHWGVSDNAVYAALQEVYDGIVGDIAVSKILSWKKRYVRADIKVDWLIGDNSAFTKAFPLNRFLASVLKHTELNDVLTIHRDALASVSRVGPRWRCMTRSAQTLMSDYPPLVRHGIETYDVDLPDDIDQSAIRIALARAPVPFKPFDF